LATAALANLLEFQGLTDDQFEQLAANSVFETNGLQRIIRRRRLLKALSKESVDSGLFELSLASSDDAVQRALVLHRGINREQLEILASDGCNKAVRNMAKQRLDAFA
jgi:hypothetical protein